MLEKGFHDVDCQKPVRASDENLGSRGDGGHLIEVVWVSR